MSALRIAIVGGGIGGVAAAAYLARRGLEATVHEQAAALGEVGAGLVVTPNAVRLLRRLGTLDRLEDTAVRLEVGWEFRRWEDGRVLFAQQLGEACRAMYGEHTYVTHRADLLATVLAAVDPARVRLGARCVEAGTDGDGARLVLVDGTVVDADVVIGADGVHSRVAGAVGVEATPRFSGLCAWRCLVPADEVPDFLRRPVQTLWLGPHRHLVHYPIAGGDLINVVAFAPAGEWRRESWSDEGEVDDLRTEFAGWDPRVTQLLAAAPATGRWALLDRDPLPWWTRGRVTLLGDAAHPMFPFFAQGAAQAIEDAAVLARCLAADPADPGAALLAYERIRRPRATRVQQASRTRAAANHLPDGDEQRRRDQALAGQDPLAHNAWLYGHDAEVD